MSRRGDFANDLAAVKATTDSEVASLLKLVGEGRSTTLSAPAELNTADSAPANKRANKQTQEPDGAPPVARETRRRSSESQPQLRSDEDAILQNVTTRLTLKTNQLLTETALRQKLAKKVPDTRQDIIEAALQEWFARAGYTLVDE